MANLISLNPSTNEVLGEVEVSTAEEVSVAVARARKAFGSWAVLPLARRTEYLLKIIEIIERRAGDIAELTVQEMGMPISEARDDVGYSTEFFNYYLDTAEEHLAPKVTYEDDKEINTVYREPRGVVACIVPWNFPLANFVWACGQNLAAGNTVVLKHSEEVPLFSKLLEKIIAESGLPDGVMNFIYGNGEVGDMLVRENIDMICFTGSTKTGHHLAQVAAEKFIPFLAELGGSAPGIVFEDINIDEVIETITTVRFMNCGQMCDAQKRLIVHESLYDEVVSRLSSILQAKKIGDACDETTEIGPLVSKRQADLLVSQVEDAVSQGATIVCGGKVPNDMEGAYFEPTIVTNVIREMRVWREEVFGPVLPIVSFKTEEEAIQLANDTKYGLGSYIYTGNSEKFDRVARALQAGMVAHNNASYLKACNPFGGYKSSGMGREHGEFGFHEVTQIKVVAKQK